MHTGPTGVGMAVVGVVVAIAGIVAGGDALAGLLIAGIALIGGGAFMVSLGGGSQEPPE